MLNVSTGSQPHALQTPCFSTCHPDILRKYPAINIQNTISYLLNPLLDVPEPCPPCSRPAPRLAPYCQPAPPRARPASGGSRRGRAPPRPPCRGGRGPGHQESSSRLAPWWTPYAIQPKRHSLQATTPTKAKTRPARTSRFFALSGPRSGPALAPGAAPWPSSCITNCSQRKH